MLSMGFTPQMGFPRSQEPCAQPLSCGREPTLGVSAPTAGPEAACASREDRPQVLNRDMILSQILHVVGDK